METFSTPRYETKIETFDSCIMNSTNQREITSNIVEQAMIQAEDDDHHNESTPIQDNNGENQTIQAPSIQSNIQPNMTLTPVRLPAILDGEYYSVIRVDDSNVTVRCLQCQKLLNGNLKSTGNFLSHIKRVHPTLIEKIKTKSHQRKPAIAYIDTSSDKASDIVKTRKRNKKNFPKSENENNLDETLENPPNNWPEIPPVRRRRSDEPDPHDISKISQHNSYTIEDEFDAVGRNIAAKLRNMRLDQRIIAEKLLNDVLFEAQLGTLHRDSNLRV